MIRERMLSRQLVLGVIVVSAVWAYGGGLLVAVAGQSQERPAEAKPAEPSPQPEEATASNPTNTTERAVQTAESGGGEAAKRSDTTMPALRFKMTDIDGKEQDLMQYHGNVVMIVNVASKCGLTPQYKELQALYEKYKDKGFVILGFPANDFLRQEPGDEAQIKSFCTTNYGVTFPMFSKIKVKGREKAPLYDYLTSKKAGHEFGGAIEWNFGKFIIDRNGEIVARFHPRTKPDDKKVIAALEKALAAPIPADSPLAAPKAEQPATSQPSK